MTEYATLHYCPEHRVAYDKVVFGRRYRDMEVTKDGEPVGYVKATGYLGDIPYFVSGTGTTNKMDTTKPSKVGRKRGLRKCLLCGKYFQRLNVHTSRSHKHEKDV